MLFFFSFWWHQVTNLVWSRRSQYMTVFQGMSCRHYQLYSSNKSISLKCFCEENYSEKLIPKTRHSFSWYTMNRYSIVDFVRSNDFQFAEFSHDMCGVGRDKPSFWNPSRILPNTNVHYKITNWSVYFLVVSVLLL